ncbi:MAG: hypothetical protein ABI876_09675 [Bacteroidota bacterium]
MQGELPGPVNLVTPPSSDTQSNAGGGGHATPIATGGFPFPRVAITSVCAVPPQLVVKETGIQPIGTALETIALKLQQPCGICADACCVAPMQAIAIHTMTPIMIRYVVFVMMESPNNELKEYNGEKIIRRRAGFIERAEYWKATRAKNRTLAITNGKIDRGKHFSPLVVVRGHERSMLHNRRIDY